MTAFTLWLAHAWASLSAVVAHDWPFYVIVVPVVGIVAYGWSCVYPVELPTGSEDDEASYW